MNKTHQLYNKQFNAYKDEYDSEDLNEEDKLLFGPSQYKIFNKKKEKSGSTKEKVKGKPQKPLWFEINKEEFHELTNDIYNNQDNKDFKLTIKGRNYNLKKAKEFWTEVTTHKISKIEAKKLYKESIQKEINALKGEKVITLGCTIF